MEMIQRPHSSQQVEGKRRRKFPDFELTKSGLQVKDVDPGRGSLFPSHGDTVVLSWEGYTVNYKGLPFETRKLQERAKVEAEPLRFKVGDGSVIPGIDEAVRSMREGGIRQVIVPVELGYDAEKSLGPRPSTFSGQRALDFVLDNTGGLMDKTLLFNMKLKHIYPASA